MKTSTNTIPDGILKNFLEYNVGLGLKKAVRTDCNFLWNRDDLELYRIDVWTEEYCKEFDLNIRKIGYSYFVHYDSKDEVLIDKTIHEQRKPV